MIAIRSRESVIQNLEDAGCENITVKDSVVKGEYLAWYSDGLTLIDCEMTDTDLAFEKSGWRYFTWKKSWHRRILWERQKYQAWC